MKIDETVIEVLERVTVDGNVVRMPQLSRELYVKTNKVLECLGGKWSRKLGGHLFDCADPGDRLTDAITMGEIVDPQKELQFFETPPELADRMVELADLRDGQEVLEPSAGRGAILDAIVRSGKACYAEACEIDATNCDCLLDRFETAVTPGDFLMAQWPMKFDRILMNPPFRNGQDIKHVRHAFDLLKPGAGGWWRSPRRAGRSARTASTPTSASGCRSWAETGSRSHRGPSKPAGRWSTPCSWFSNGLEPFYA